MLDMGIFKIVTISFKLICDIIMINNILIITIVVIVIVTGIAEPIFKTKEAVKLIRVWDVWTVVNLVVTMLNHFDDVDQ